MRISDWSSDVCSSDLAGRRRGPARDPVERRALSLGERLMLSAKLRAALDNLLPDAGEDEAYLGTPTLRDAAVLIAFTARPDPGDAQRIASDAGERGAEGHPERPHGREDRKSPRLNSSHSCASRMT